jgi:hypothetical protein
MFFEIMQIHIDRTKQFDPADVVCLGKGCTVYYQDPKCLQLEDIDMDDITTTTGLGAAKTLNGVVRNERVKKEHAQIDAATLYAMWERRFDFPEKYTTETDNSTTFFSAEGTIMRRPNGDLCYLYFGYVKNKKHDEGTWYLGYRFLIYDVSASRPAMVFD